MTYQYINNSYKGIQGIVTYVNDTSGGIMTPLMLLVVWIVIFLSQVGYGFQRAMLSSSLIASVLSILMVVVNLLSPTYMYISFVFLGLSVVMTRLTFNA